MNVLAKAVLASAMPGSQAVIEMKSANPSDPPTRFRAMKGAIRTLMDLKQATDAEVWLN